MGMGIGISGKTQNWKQLSSSSTGQLDRYGAYDDKCQLPKDGNLK